MSSSVRVVGDSRLRFTTKTAERPVVVGVLSAESSPAVACRCRSRTDQDGSREPTPAALGVEHPGTSNLDPTPLFPFGHQLVGVPENLSIVGFDDTPLARLLSPPLTTVRQPLREIGQVAWGPRCGWPPVSGWTATMSSWRLSWWCAALPHRWFVEPDGFSRPLVRSP